MKRITLAIGSLLILTGFIIVGNLGRAVAQDTEKPLLEISGVDISQFPMIKLFVYGENLTTSLASVNLQVEEDRSVQTVVEDQFADVGIQTALVLDTSQSILSPGNSGAPRYTEATNAIRRFVVDRRVLSAETDWLSVQSVGGGPTAFQMLAAWNRDHNAIVNTLTQTQPVGLSATTSLFGLIKFALDQFEDTGIPANRQKFIVVFSDGLDIVSALDLENIAAQAARTKIRLHTVLVGPEGREARDNLQRLATLTGGRYVRLQRPEDVDVIWDLIAQARGQRIITYRTTRPQPAEVNVIANLPSGRQLNRAAPVPVTGAQPVAIQITQPADGVPIIRQADAPQNLTITLELTWPDNHPRTLQRVEYEFNNQLYLREADPFHQVTIPIAALSDNVYTLRVRAVDEVGLTSEARPLSVALQSVATQPAQPIVITATAPITGVAAPTTGRVISSAAPIRVPTQVVTGTGGITKATVTTGTGARTGAGATTGAITGTRVITQPKTATGASANTGTGVGAAPGVATETGGIFGRAGRYLADLLRTRLGVDLAPTTIWLILILPLILILLSLIYAGRRRQSTARGEPMTTGYEPPDFTEPARMNDIDDATEPVRLPAFSTVAPAYLIYQEGGDHLPKKLPIDAGREVRIGRRREYCDVIIDDKRVSRLHAIIAEKADGFHIRDEGSAGGTLVNRRQLGVSTDRLLKHGDIVSFNTIAYRFEMAESQYDEPTIPATKADMDDDKTEPLVPPPAGSQ